MATQARLLKTKIRLLNGTQGDWAQLANYQLAQGEPAIEFVPAMPTDENPDAVLTSVKVKIGDGFTPYKDLPYVGDDVRTELMETISTLEDTVMGMGNEVFQITATDLDAVTGATEADRISNYLATNDATVKKGNIAIVTRNIANGTNGYTAYVYSDTAWAAMDGNYNAENVYFNEDLTLTADIGAQKLEGKNSMTLDAKGKSLEAVLKSILAKTIDPTVAAPHIKTVTINSITTDTGTDEIGSKIKSVKYTVDFKDGTYSFGSKEGDTVHTDTNANVSPTYEVVCEAGTGGNITTYTKNSRTATVDIEESKRPQINSTSSKTYGNVYATASWNASTRVPVNNLGDEHNDLTIGAGSSDGSAAINKTGYRSWFVYVGTDNTTTVDSDFIRNSTNNGKFNNSGVDGDGFKPGVEIPFKTTRVVVALPADSLSLLDVKDDAALGASAFSNFTKSTIAVEGANGYDAVNYNVWVAENAKGYQATSYKFKFG